MIKIKLAFLVIFLSQFLIGQNIEYSVPSGFYEDEFELVLTKSILGDIRYTIDGSEPTFESQIYSNTFLVTERNSEANTISNIPTNPPETNPNFVWKMPSETIPKARIIKAAIFQEEELVSPIFYEEYFIGSPLTDMQMPVFSIQIDTSELFNYETGIYVPGKDYDDNPTAWNPGNYFNQGDDWERVMSLTYYENQALIFRQNTELQIHGAASRIMPCKSLRISAKNSLGNGLLQHAFFKHRPWTEYKRLTLRNSGQDWNNTLFSDVLMQDLLDSQGVENQASQQVIVFINGSYWGIHNLRERYDKYYFSNLHSNEIEDIDYVEIAMEFVAKEGSAIDYEIMNDSLLLMDLSEHENFRYISDQIDIENYINHHISKTYGGGGDWSGNNERFWRVQDGISKWRWIGNDYDDAFKTLQYDSYQHATKTDGVNWPNPEWSTRLFRSLMTNKDFASRYKKRLKFHLENTYSKEHVVSKIDSIASIYRPEIPRHIDRWAYPKSVEEWEQNILLFKEFAAKRPQFLWNNFEEYFPDVKSNIFELEIYPNPAKDFFFVNPPELFGERASIEIFSLDGRRIHESVLSNSNRNRIELQNIEQGIYIIVLMHENQQYSQKLLIH